jgi:integrase
MSAHYQEVSMKTPPGLTRLRDARWRIRATATDPKTGKLREVQRTLPKQTTRANAIRSLLDIKEEIRAGDAKTKGEPISLEDYAMLWIEERAGRLRRTVVERDGWALGLILAQLGNILVDQLTRTNIRQFATKLKTMKTRGGGRYAPESVRTVWRVMGKQIRDASLECDLRRNPAEGVTAPKTNGRARREARTLTHQELSALLAQVKLGTPHRYAEVLTLALTGMRAGELAALRWSDVDWPQKRICIERSAYRGTIPLTKTEAPREAALPASLEGELRMHAGGSRLVDDVLVFPRIVGTPRTPSSLYKPLRRAADVAGIAQRVTPQVLRRTFNTLLLMQGADRIVLRSQMGHCSEEMTERYAGISVEAKLGAVGELASNLGLYLGPGSQVGTERDPPKLKKPLISGAYQVAAAGIEPAKGAFARHCGSTLVDAYG